MTDDSRLHARIVLQQAIYCGAPAALTAVNIARQILDDIEGRPPPTS